ncbi:hypothetical protein B0T16DRAFT_393203 [Cercophora newfieldiana]|uniref:Uncharacterized protein n=1 Tax=Cercophora newfieldiana TaxID=92897 RepID=A0AA39XV45_9PEZI|nr:hypothetical protein B0T16DRAFT_393203 [Cercophora newfieldiana]
MAVLATGSVVKVLGGIDIQNPGPPVEPGFALFLSPIGYLSWNSDWYGTLGDQSKIFAPINRFLDYASEAMKSRGKSFVLGMLTHWLLKPGDVERVADRTDTDALDIWTRHATMRRYGTVMILRRVTLPAGDQLQMIWYDPWRNDEKVQKMYGARKTAIFDYRAEVVEKMKHWAATNAVIIHSRYWGGYPSVDPLVAGDSVKLSLEYLGRLVSADRVEDILPDKTGFLKQGFYMTKS